MADEKKGDGNPWEPLVFVGGLIIALIVLWVMNGGPERDKGLRGLFIQPPAPVGTGEPYGPGSGTTTNNQ